MLKVCLFLLGVWFLWDYLRSVATKIPPPDGVIPGLTSFFCQRGEKQIDTENLANGVKDGMFFIENVMRDTSFQNVDSLLTMFEFGYGNSRVDWKSYLKREIERYANLDFGAYIEEKYHQNLVSERVRDTLLVLKSSFESFVHNTHPTLIQTEQFWQAKIDALAAFTGCRAEEELLLVYYQSAIGFARYLYAAFPQNNGLLSTIDFRNCNFWQALICGTFSVVVGAVAGVLLWEIGSWAEHSVFFLGVRILSGTPARIVISVAVGIYTAVSMYNLCCSWWNNTLPCGMPQGLGVRVLACNLYELVVYGTGSGALSYSWNNVNTNPAIAVTQSPVLSVSIPDPGQLSLIRVTTICSNEQPFSNEWERVLTSNEPGVIGWAVIPPTEASVGQTIPVAVSANVSFPYMLSWSASFGAGVVSTGMHTANVTLWASGTVTVTATLSNTCGGQPVSISRTITVKP